MGTKDIIISNLILIMTAGGAVAAVQPTKYEIYPNSATVTFSAEITSEDVISLPAAFTPNSVKIISVTGAKVVAFNAESLNVVPETPYYLKTEKQEIDKLNKDLNVKLAKLSSLELNAVMLDNTKTENVKPLDLPAFLTTVSGLREKNAKDIFSINEDIKIIREKIKVLQDNFNKKLTPNNQEKTIVKIKLSGKGTVTFEASTTQAYWRPKYSMDLNTTTGEIETIFEVSTYQHTGMEWRGALEFFSNQPESNIYFTELPPLKVDIARPQPIVSEARTLSMLKSANKYEMEETLSDDENNNFVAQPPTVTETGLYFKINSAIPGDKTLVNLPVETFTLKAFAEYRLAADLGEYALMVATVDNLTKNILPAKADLSMDGKASSVANLGNIPEGGKLVIPFGKSKNIKINKTNIITKKDKSWLKGVMKDGYTLKITNGLGRQVKVVVSDRVPEPVDSKISIDNLKISQQPLTEPKNGVYKWELTLAPKETKKIEVLYDIKYPSDGNIYFR